MQVILGYFSLVRSGIELKVGRNMHRTFVLLFATSVFTAAPLAMGQTYSCSVMYPLTLPTGFTYINVKDISANQAVGEIAGPSGTDAFLWSAAGDVDLSPTNNLGSIANGVSGAQQLGEDFIAGASNPHALLWTGTANSLVDLNPTDLGNVTLSEGWATNGTQQVGEAVIVTGTNPRTQTQSTHAVLWTGTANSAVDLNPTDLTGITTSFAYGTDGSQQVGDGNDSGYYNLPGTPLLWSGTAVSAVDLSPTNLSQILASEAVGVSGSQQVGYGEASSGFYHALLWTGTAASAVDLNTTEFGTPYSEALATNGAQQVGFGYTGNSDNDAFENQQALLWTDTAASAVQLQAFLPSSGTWTGSNAMSIDPTGNIYGTASGTYNAITGTFAVEWSPIPEPTTGSLLPIAGSGIILRLRRNQPA